MFVFLSLFYTKNFGSAPLNVTHTFSDDGPKDYLNMLEKKHLSTEWSLVIALISVHYLRVFDRVSNKMHILQYCVFCWLFYQKLSRWTCSVLLRF